MISVIIAAYNAEKTIERSVTSVINDPYVLEVFLIDDCSTDDTYNLIKGLEKQSDKIIVRRQDSNKGPSAARNIALRETKAPWVTILDSDDFILPGRFGNMLNHSEDYDFIADDMFQVDEGNIDGERKLLLDGKVKLPVEISLEDFVLSNVTNRNKERAELGFIKPIIKTSFLKRNRISYSESMRLGEDYELYARSLGLGAKMLLIPAQGYVSVVRRNSLSSKHSIQDLEELKLCDYKLMSDLTISKAERSALVAHSVSINKRLQWRKLIESVKAKDIRGIVKTFCHQPAVTIYLIENLIEQFYIRFLSSKKSI
jgi:succinoglycan biosynthesis protein ExoU